MLQGGVGYWRPSNWPKPEAEDEYYVPPRDVRFTWARERELQREKVEAQEYRNRRDAVVRLRLDMLQHRLTVLGLGIELGRSSRWSGETRITLEAGELERLLDHADGGEREQPPEELVRCVYRGTHKSSREPMCAECGFDELDYAGIPAPEMPS